MLDVGHCPKGRLQPNPTIQTWERCGSKPATEGVELQNDELSKTGKETMRIWLEHDPVALALLVVGLGTVELLAFII